MSADDLNPFPTRSRRRSQRIALWLLGCGVTLALAGNVYQFVRAERFAQDVDLIQRNTQRQIADVKEAVSGVLEQNLLRYDDLSKQLEQTSSSTLEQAKSEVNRSRSELSRTLNQRNQEMVTQLSDLRSDLRQDSSTKLSEISKDLERTDSELRRVVTSLDVVSERVISAPVQPTELAVAAAEPVSHEHEQAAPASKKKQFWAKLNPFRSSKKKTEEAGDPDE